MIFTTLCVMLLLFATFIGASRLLFRIGNSLGLVCDRADRGELFDTRSLSHATGVTVAPGQVCEVTIQPTGPWWDGYRDAARPGIKAGPVGFGWDKTSWPMVGGIPLRRHPTVNWFAVVARVGRTGNEEHALVFDRRAPSGAHDGESTRTARLTARSGGEIFIFVNDAVIGLPWLADFFYRNNRGTARFRVHLDANATDTKRSE